MNIYLIAIITVIVITSLACFFYAVGWDTDHNPEVWEDYTLEDI